MAIVVYQYEDNFHRHAVEIELIETLPQPEQGNRWVGPIRPTLQAAFAWDAGLQEPLPFEVEWAGQCQPTLQSDGRVTVQTRPDRAMARTEEGWWIQLPLRPSALVGQLLKEESGLEGATPADREWGYLTRGWGESRSSHGKVYLSFHDDRILLSDGGHQALTAVEVHDLISREVGLLAEGETLGEVTWKDYGLFRVATIRLV